MRAIRLTLAALLVSGCASGTASGTAHPARVPAPAKAPPAPAASVAEAAPPAAPAVPELLPDAVEGGDIPRPLLLLVLKDGVGRFLQKVRAEPDLERGRFVGWRIVALAEGSPQWSPGVLQPGDTLLRVNGQSIERPEQFKNVWDSLATESQLVLSVVRGGKASEVRHRIVQ